MANSIDWGEQDRDPYNEIAAAARRGGQGQIADDPRTVAQYGANSGVNPLRVLDPNNPQDAAIIASGQAVQLPDGRWGTAPQSYDVSVGSLLKYPVALAGLATGANLIAGGLGAGVSGATGGGALSGGGLGGVSGATGGGLAGLEGAGLATGALEGAAPAGGLLGGAGGGGALAGEGALLGGGAGAGMAGGAGGGGLMTGAGGSALGGGLGFAQSLGNGGSLINGIPNNVLAGAGQAALGAVGAGQQADAFKDVANQNLALGAPYRGLLEQSYQPGFDLMSQPGYGDAFNRAADISSRSWSAKAGNPAGSPTAQAGILNDVWQQNYLPTMSNYRGQLGQFGGLGLNTSGAAQLGGAQQAGGALDALGAGLDTALNPKTDWAKILQGMGGGQNPYSLNIGGMKWGG